MMAEGPGFEPGLTGPEPVVLPLDDPSATIEQKNIEIITIRQASLCKKG